MDLTSLLGNAISKAEEALSEYPLCNHCLGRLFAKLGVGIDNYERGLTVKTLLAIKLYQDHLEGRLDRERLLRLAINAGAPITRLYERLHGERVNVQACHVCGNAISRDFFEKIAHEACDKIREFNARSFVVGVTLDKEILDRELDILVKHGVDTSESIKRELKREIGKLVRDICDVSPEFSKPDIVLHVVLRRDFTYTIHAHPSPLYIELRARKIVRGIPRFPWSRRYTIGSISIEEVLREVFKEALMTEDIRVKIGSFEGINTRIIGSGRRVVVELRNPKIREISKDAIIDKIKQYSQILVVEPLGIITKTRLAKIRELNKRVKKTYRVTVLVPDGVDASGIARLEDYFRGVEITMRSQSRTIRRKIYVVKAITISPYIFEALIMCESGVDIKRLVECRGDELTPCFGEVIGKSCIPLEIDLVHVEE